MFSICTGCRMIVTSENEEIGSRKKITKTLIMDAVLTLIFNIIAILGLTGVLPLSVGITFCFLFAAQGLCTGITKAFTTLIDSM